MKEQFIVEDTLSMVGNNFKNLLMGLCNVDLIHIVVVLIALLIITGQRPIYKWISTHLFWIALIIWSFGFVLYFNGFNEHGCEHNTIALFARASISAIEMFASHSDLIEVKCELHHDHIYMTLFSVTHFCAVLVSAIFVINLLGLKLRNRLKLIYWWIFRKNNIYVFWGINDESLNLAKDIKAKNKSRLVFVHPKVNQEHEHTEHHFSFGKYFEFSHNSKNEEIEEIISNLKGYILDYKNADSLKRIKFLLKKKPHVFFLSNHEENNLKDLLTIKELDILKNKDITFYCHAKRDLFNQRLASCSMYEIQENDKQKKCLRKKDKNATHEIKLIDSSYLSILELKHAPEAHPVNFVSIETNKDGNRTGVVTSPFNALILGFGDTGQEALSFLYEFSAFVGPDGKRSPYHLVAIDKYMNNIEGDYLAMRPAIKGNDNIELVCTDTNTLEYWNIVEELAKEGLNYVVVALGDDKLNLSVAMQLQEYLMRKVNKQEYKIDMKRFCIYVKYKQAQKTDEKIECLYDNLRLFGLDEIVFTWECVSNEKYKEMANDYRDKYELLKKENNYNFRDDSAPKDDDKIKTPIEEIRDKERKSSQNLSNAYHKDTKIKLLGEVRISELERYIRTPQDVKDFKGNYEYKNKETGKINKEVSTLMTNLAKCEHLRWNAAIEMLGYTQNTQDRSSCNLTTMQHNCLTDWDDLHKIWEELNGKKQYCEYKMYDYCVVETSIKIYMENKLNKSTNDRQGINRWVDKS